MFLPSNITLQFGDSGDFVSELQRRLSLVNCFSAANINGFYDGITVSGVTHFQSMNGLHADGVAGPETLRRLNGVIAGDSGSVPDSAAEEQAHTADLVHNWVVDPNNMQQDPSLLSPAPVEAPVPASVAPPAPMLDPFAAAFAAAPANAYVAPPAPPAPSQADNFLIDQARQQQQPMMQQPVYQPVPPPQPLSPEMAQWQQPAQQVPQPFQPQPTQQPQMRPQIVYPTQEPPIQQPQPMQQPPVQQQYQQPLQQQPQAEQARAEPQGLVQRAVRFTNAMMQKLADYMENKLPSSVLQEVREVGNLMARSGVKEAPVPTGPEMRPQEPQIPRGPEQPRQQRS